MTVEDYNIQDKCCGCFSCANVCPVHAIEMVQNKEGFYYPVIKQELCLKCGKCSKVCSAILKPEKSSKFIKTYSFQGEDSIRKKSSSGGFFYHLATYAMERGGVVYGARFNPQSKEVEHVSTDDVSLDELLRSKYSQSKIGNAFLDVQRELNLGRLVLFSGTPCQIYGLKAFLKRDYDNLITMDFVCHGVPSPGYFKDWILSFEEKRRSKIIDVTFREKDNGWREQVIKIYYADGIQEIMKSSSYYYYRYFLQNITLRKSCFSCNFPEHHYSDITVKDYWEINGDDNRGISAIVINTNKGQQVANLATGKDLKQISFSNISNSFIRHEHVNSYKRYKKIRNYYMSKYAKYGFVETVKKYNGVTDFMLQIIGNVRLCGGKIKGVIKRIINTGENKTDE